MAKARISRAAARRIDEAWHDFQMRRNEMQLAEQHASARINFSIFDKMPKRARKLIDELGPEAPAWANEWFASGQDPGHRRKSSEVPMFPYQSNMRGGCDGV